MCRKLEGSVMVNPQNFPMGGGAKSMGYPGRISEQGGGADIFGFEKGGRLFHASGKGDKYFPSVFEKGRGLL